MSSAGNSTQEDVVGVFDSSFNQLFADAEAMRALIKPEAEIAKHPLETGGTFSDNIVFLPVEIELSVIPKPDGYQDTYQQIKAAFLAAGLVSVQTKADTYANMMIYKIPRDETPEMFDTAAIAISLREFQQVTAQFQQLPQSSVKKPSNASTVQTGQKTSTTANPTGAQSSAAYDLIFGSP